MSKEAGTITCSCTYGDLIYQSRLQRLKCASLENINIWLLLLSVVFFFFFFVQLNIVLQPRQSVHTARKWPYKELASRSLSSTACVLLTHMQWWTGRSLMLLFFDHRVSTFGNQSLVTCNREKDLNLYAKVLSQWSVWHPFFSLFRSKHSAYRYNKLSSQLCSTKLFWAFLFLTYFPLYFETLPLTIRDKLNLSL